MKEKTKAKIKGIAELSALGTMTFVNGFGTGSIMNKVAAKHGKIVAGTLASMWMILYHAVLIDPMIEKVTNDLVEGFVD